MLGSFKIRILIVIVVVAVLGVIMQSNYSSKRVVTPVLQYIMKTDYNNDLKKTFSSLFSRKDKAEQVSPVSGNAVLHTPCEYLKIEKSYGWYYNRGKNKQEFSPGVYLQVKDNTLVKPIIDGTVVDIKRDNNEGVVTVKHSEGFFSVYGGLKEVLVYQQMKLKTDTPVGKAGEHLYLEVRTNEGPVDPQGIFK